MTGTNYLLLLRLTTSAIALAVTSLLVLVLDASVLRERTIAVRFRAATATACAGCAVALVVLMSAPTSGSLAAGMLVATPLTQLMQIALLVLTILVLLLAASARFTSHVGEYCALLLFATTAMLLLVSTQNLLLLFISIEFLSLSLYLLAAFDKQSCASAEAGLKYFLFGGVSAGMLLFGMSLLYGYSGSLALDAIGAAVQKLPGDPLLRVAIVLFVAGFGFKVAAAPFHFWAPEVYQGAPTVSAALIAAGSKVASFFAFFVVFSVGLAGAAGEWARLLAVVSAISMIWGNFAAIAQTSVRRLLAYSAVAHAGYLLIALVVHNRQSMAALVYYVITYSLATLGAFALLSALGDADEIGELAGLGQRAPGLAFCLMIFLLSLAGVPPLAGFFGKFYIFVSAMGGREHWLGLVLLALATSVVSFYYYVRILKQVYVVAPVGGPVRIPLATRVVVWGAAMLVVLLGCLPNLLLSRIGAGY